MTRDLVPREMLSDLTKGRALVTNWHVFEPRAVHVGGVSAKVVKAGVRVTTRETIAIGPKTTTARGNRYLTLDDYQPQVAAGMLDVLEEQHDEQGNLKKVKVESARYVESDTALFEPRARPRSGRQTKHPGDERRGPPRLPYPSRGERR